MNNSTIKRIDDFFKDFPIAKGKSSTTEEIIMAEKKLKLKFDEDYVFFILKYGGSMIGNREIYGFHNSELMGEDTVVELTEYYRENEEGNKDWLIIGSDYSGNSIGIDSNGHVIVYDHDFQEFYILGNSFEDYILKGLDERNT